MAAIRHALALSLLLGAAPALAQAPTGRQAPAGRQAHAAVPAQRAVAATGQTKPAGAVSTGLPQPVNAAEMIKAQKAAEARSKAWDSKMRTTMGSICHGC